MQIKEDGLYLFNEKVIKKFTDEYQNTYYMTKGFKYFYLYKQSTYIDRNSDSYNYKLAAFGTPKINTYIKENNLKEESI